MIGDCGVSALRMLGVLISLGLILTSRGADADPWSSGAYLPYNNWARLFWWVIVDRTKIDSVYTELANIDRIPSPQLLARDITLICHCKLKQQPVRKDRGEPRARDQNHPDSAVTRARDR